MATRIMSTFARVGRVASQMATYSMSRIGLRKPQTIPQVKIGVQHKYSGPSRFPNVPTRSHVPAYLRTSSQFNNRLLHEIMGVPYSPLQSNMTSMGYSSYLKDFVSQRIVITTPWQELEATATKCLKQRLSCEDSRHACCGSSLSELHLGGHLATGCNSTVYSCRPKTMVHVATDTNFSTELDPTNNTIESFPFVVKVHNYSIPSKPVQLPRHPCILPVLNKFKDKRLRLEQMEIWNDMSFSVGARTDYHVMKRLSGTLDDLLKTTKLNTNSSVWILLQLLEADTHMKSNDVAHRDIKLNNILFDQVEDGYQIALSDFDDACSPLRLKIPKDGSKGGNPMMLAPEIMSASSHHNYSKADLWAIGCVGYQIFTGDNPFEVNGVDKMSYTLDNLPPFPDTCPDLVQRLLRAMLHPDPAQRPSAAQCADILHLYLLGWITETGSLGNNRYRLQLPASPDGTTPEMCHERGLLPPQLILQFTRDLFESGKDWQSQIRLLWHARLTSLDQWNMISKNISNL